MSETSGTSQMTASFLVDPKQVAGRSMPLVDLRKRRNSTNFSEQGKSWKLMRGIIEVTCNDERNVDLLHQIKQGGEKDIIHTSAMLVPRGKTINGDQNFMGMKPDNRTTHTTTVPQVGRDGDPSPTRRHLETNTNGLTPVRRSIIQSTFLIRDRFRPETSETLFEQLTRRFNLNNRSGRSLRENNHVSPHSSRVRDNQFRQPPVRIGWGARVRCLANSHAKESCKEIKRQQGRKLQWEMSTLVDTWPKLPGT